MARLIKIAILLGLVWSAYWYAAAYGMRRGVATWFAERAAQGWQAEYATAETSGYPLRHITVLTSPALADPETGIAWQADWLHLDSPAIWPGRQTLRFPASPQRLSHFDDTLTIVAQNMQADLHLLAGLDLTLDRMALTSGAWQVEGDAGAVLGAGSLTLEMQRLDAPDTYRIGIDAAGLTPGAALRRLTRSNDALPQSFETLALDMRVRFDRPWDRRALEDRRPQPVAIDLARAEIRWGALRILATGQVTVDAAGIPTGQIALKAENWREMLEMAQESGAISPRLLEPLSRILNLLSGVAGNPETLDIRLEMERGQVSIGPFPLGPAPRLILR